MSKRHIVGNLMHWLHYFMKGPLRLSLLSVSLLFIVCFAIVRGCFVFAGYHHAEKKRVACLNPMWSF